MIEPPSFLDVAALPAAVVHVVVPRPEIPKVMGPAIMEVIGAVSAQGVGPAGPVFAHHLRIDRDVFDFEVGVPVGGPVAPAGRVQPGTRPGGTMARTVYHGPYEGLHRAWEAFDEWIVGQGYVPGPELVETYLAGPESGPDSSMWRTEFLRSVSRR